VDALESSLRLLHPFMPFVTEEIWQTLRNVIGNVDDWGPSIMVAPYPHAQTAKLDEAAEAAFATAMEIVGAVRRLRSEAGVPPGQRVAAVLAPGDGSRLPEEVIGYLATLAKADTTLGTRESAPQPALSDLAAGVEIYLPLAGLVDVEKESAKLRKEMETTAKDLEKVRAKLSNEQFLSRAPAAVVEKEKGIQAELEGRLSAAQARLEGLANAG
jgi:valyl-tRNA synthetase